MNDGTTPKPDDLKKEAEDLAAETAYYEAQSKRDTAKKALEAATPASAAASAEAAKVDRALALRKAEAEAQTTEAGARKAQIDADTAKTKSLSDALPSSGITGTAEAAEGGKAEAMLLAAVALRGIAVQFAGKLMKCQTVPPKGWVLWPSSAPPRFDQLTAFDAQHEGLASALKRAGIEPDTDDKLASAMPSVGVALSVVDKLLGFFRSDHKLIGIDVASADDALVVALAEQLLHLGQQVHLPGLFLPAPSAHDNPVVGRLASPFEWAERVQEHKAFAERAIAVIEAAQLRAQAIRDDVTSTAEAKAQAEADLAGLDATLKKDRDTLAVHKGLLERLDAWVKALTSPDAQGRLPLALVAQQGQLRQVLDTGSAVVLLQLHKTAGSLHIKRNFWSTLLWFTPFHVMGGAVASFTAFDGSTGALIASCYLPRHGGYHVVTEVQNQVNQAMSMLAWKP